MWIKFSQVALCFCFCVVVCKGYSQRYDYAKYSYPKRPTTTTTTNSPIRRYNLGGDNVKLRHTRFENLNRVNSKIDSMNAFRTSDSHRLRHNRWHSSTTTTTTTTEDSLLDNYGELEDDDSDDDYDNDFQSLEDDEDSDDLEYDDFQSDLFPDEENRDDGYQDEEPTEKPTTRPLSSFSEYKWRILGTREKVEESRRQELHLNPTNEQLLYKAARDHYLRVKQEGTCETPKPRVVYVQSEYPNPNKKYTPHCTVLHRCTEDTGCCNHGSYKCQYKNRELVHLYFYVRAVGVTDSKVEKLSFYNHTACECKDITKNETSHVMSVKPGYFGIDFKFANNAIFHLPENLRGCKCPEAYTSKLSYNSKCACDCDSDDEECILFKKGKEHFSLTDRRCVSENKCGTPACEYGTYNREKGKCPTKQEKLELFRRLKVN